jgi:predicted membrane protein
VGRAPALLGGALLAALLAYYSTSTHWFGVGEWGAVAWIAFVLMPAVFGLVLCALPLRTWRGLGAVGLAFALLAVVLTVAHLALLANFARLGATTFLGWWFLELFEEVSWVVLVALVIPWVDAYSVWRGPTKTIVNNHPHVFDVLSFAFPIPGEHAAAQLGVPDLLFFALFLGAASRFRLRVYWTWLCLVAALGATIALTVWWNLSGLPALPGIALGFLVPNADLLWRAVRHRPRALQQGDALDVRGVREHVDGPRTDE